MERFPGTPSPLWEDTTQKPIDQLHRAMFTCLEAVISVSVIIDTHCDQTDWSSSFYCKTQFKAL